MTGERFPLRWRLIWWARERKAARWLIRHGYDREHAAMVVERLSGKLDDPGRETP
jgi:hypothetical protein